MSSAQAEYTAACSTVLAIDHTRQVIQEILLGEPDTPMTIPIYCDSTSAIAIAKHPKDTQATRHIARRIHRVREAQAAGEITMIKIEGTENPADLGTKNVDPHTHRHLLPLIHTVVAP